MARVLILRLSAIGDVAMTIPAVYSAARDNPGDRFTVLTKTRLTSLFINPPANLNVTGIDTDGKGKSFLALLRFAFKLLGERYDRVIDLHDSLRTKIIRFLFLLKGTPVVAIRRNRRARQKLTRKKNKDLRPLPSVVSLYMDTIRRAGFEFEESFSSLYESVPPAVERLLSFTGRKNDKWIGIAPFSRHQEKTYPVELMEKVLAMLVENKSITVFLFGSKKREKSILKKWEVRYPRVKCVAGRFTLDEELSLISRLDLLLCMDSANMHFASLVCTEVLSVWGATHPYVGFYGYRQDPANAIQLEMPCRPCSVYGRKKCERGDRACMTQITPSCIVQKAKELLLI
jgi:ADP-heptose:LPS heptosyltransferase